MFLRSISFFLLFLALPFSTGHAQDEEQYRIGIEDVLEIQVWSRPDLSGRFTVDENGDVRLPLVGGVSASERTPAELSEELSERYRILDPSISDVLVSVSEYLSRMVNVVGEVSSPGRYTFRDIPGLWEILLTAGGPAETADLSKVQIVRKDPQPGEAQTLTVDLSPGIEEMDPSGIPEVRPKDTIVVPSIEGRPGGGDSYQVLGAVRTPGSYRVGDAATVIEALAVSGGTMDNADLRKVRLTRFTEDGVVSYELDMQGHLYQGRPVSDLALKPGDTVTVPGKSMIGPTSVFNVVIGLASIVTAFSSLIIATR